MAALDWSKCPVVESISGKVSGAWVFKGTRLPVATVIENLEELSIDEVIEQFDVTAGTELIANVEMLWGSTTARSFEVKTTWVNQ